MPHFVLEYTPHAKKDDFKPLLKKFHAIFNVNGITPASKCKSRANPLTDYLLGEDPEASFVHLSVSFLDHPTPLAQDKLRLVGDQVKAAMVEFFDGVAKVEFSMEMRFLRKELYWRNAD